MRCLERLKRVLGGCNTGFHCGCEIANVVSKMFRDSALGRIAAEALTIRL